MTTLWAMYPMIVPTIAANPASNFPKLGLGVSKPWGEVSRYDMIVEAEGHLLCVQIKSTIFGREEGCYECNVKPGSTSKPYQRGEFDFLAAYIITKDIWYIIPEKLVVHGTMGSIRLYPSIPTSKYAPYKEAWDLLR